LSNIDILLICLIYRIYQIPMPNTELYMFTYPFTCPYFFYLCIPQSYIWNSLPCVSSTMSFIVLLDRHVCTCLLRCNIFYINDVYNDFSMNSLYLNGNLIRSLTCLHEFRWYRKLKLYIYAKSDTSTNNARCAQLV